MADDAVPSLEPAPEEELWRAAAAAAADEALDLLRACEALERVHWLHAGTEQGVAVQYLPAGHPALQPFPWLGDGYCLFRAETDYADVEPAPLFALLHDWDARPGWDPTTQSMTVLRELHASPGRSDAVVQQLTQPLMGGLVGRREFCFVASRTHGALGAPDEAHASVCRWCPEAAAALAPAPPPGYTRGHLFVGAVSLRRAPGGGTRMTLLNCAAPRGAIPRAAVNMGGVRGAALLADLRKHVAATRNK